MNMEVKGVLFDFDGVIVDSMQSHLTAWNLAHRKIFNEDIDKDTLNSLKGRSSQAISHILCKNQHALQKAEILRKSKYQILDQNRNLLSLLPGYVEMSDKLIKRNIPFGIISNAPKKFLLNTMKSLQISAPFYFGFEDFPRPKPAPDPYLLGARTLGLSFPEYPSILVFEDSIHGIKAAQSAFTFPIGISTSHQKEELQEAGAKLVFKDLKEALNSEHLNDFLPKN